MPILTITLSLFLIINVFGQLSGFLDLMGEIDVQRQKKILLREMLIALGLMIFFHFFGEVLLTALHVGPATVEVAGGLILFVISLKMIFPQDRQAYENPHREEPFLVPIATPMIAGPSCLAAIMVFAHKEPQMSRVLFAIVLAWALSVSCFWIFYNVRPYVPKKALIAIERLMGLILTMMAVEMFLKGLKLFMA